MPTRFLVVAATFPTARLATSITDQMELARHGAHTFWGLLTRTPAVIAAYTIMRACRARQ